MSEVPIYRQIGDAYRVKSDTVTYSIQLHGKDIEIPFKVVHGLPEFHANQKLVSDQLDEIKAQYEAGPLRGEIAELYTEDAATMTKCLLLATLAVEPVWSKVEAWLYLAHNCCALFQACYVKVIELTSMDATAVIEKEVDSEKKDLSPNSTKAS